ncbi:ABC transporter substrate-binding protein [Paenibacillus nasutitermitis]|uniref:Sugar ABC transporter substrate-binding protein n=1 Tax=Paenibacillus nasutitermitis TaxID=1652958 RepID=A0A916ZIH8_9BACL|nr:sugar ABC transporter substrate-binding protein [Paenibacillus nasutitermitis]GGD99269.1 sugar ABC transporter substrate-binding protein [Paenibacillus nasutitermitis]
MTKSKKLISICCITLMVAMLLLAGCSSGGSSQAEGGEPVPSDSGSAVADTEKQEDVTITMWMRWPEFAELNKEVIAKFEAKYPYIHVENTEVATSQYLPQLQTAIAGSELPDIFANYSSLPLYQLHDLDVVHSLNDVIGDQKDKFEKGMFTPGMTMIDGDIYAFPITSNHRDGYVMYYNKDVLQKAGLGEQDIPKNWDDLLKVGKQIEEKTDGKAYGVVMGMQEHWLVNNIIAHLSSAITPEVLPNSHLNPHTGQYVYDTDGIVETLQYIKKLSDEEVLHPNSLLVKAPEAATLFAGGQAAFLMSGLWEIPTFYKAGFQSFGVAPLPTKDGKAMYEEVNGDPKSALYVSKKTKHFNEVKLFLQFMMDEYYKGLVSNEINFSPIPEINQSVEIKDANLKKGLDMQDNLFFFTPHPFIKNLNTVQVNEAMSGKLPKEKPADILEGYLVGQITDVKQALKKIGDAHNQLLKKTIEEVKAKGVEVDSSDWQFADWESFKSYEVK